MSVLRTAVSSSGGNFDLAQLTDGDLVKTNLLPRDSVKGYAWIQFTFAQPKTVKAVTVVGGGNRGPFGLFGELKDTRSLEASDDGNSFHRGAPASIVVNELKSWTGNADAGMKYFSGTGSYTKTINAPSGWFTKGTKLYLDLGAVKNLAEVTANGNSLGIIWNVNFFQDGSMDSLVEKEVVEDGMNYLQELSCDEYGNAVEQHDSVMKDDRDNNHITRSRKKSTDQHHGWKEKEYKDMPTGKSLINRTDGNNTEKGRPKFVSNHIHYSTTDRDARVSVKPGKPRQLNYSMQTAVDMCSHIITNVEAHLADRRDSESLPQVLANTINNLKQQGLILEEIAADTGYSSSKALQALRGS